MSDRVPNPQNYADERRFAVCRRQSVSEFKPGAELDLIPVEVHEIERSRRSHRSTPDLNIERGRHPALLADPGVECRAGVERLPGEGFQRGALIAAQIPQLTAEPQAGQRLRGRRPSRVQGRCSVK